MTLMIGWNLGSYALLAADTCQAAVDETGATVYSSRVDKVERISVGWVTGSGNAYTLQPAKKRIASASTALEVDEELKEAQRVTLHPQYGTSLLLTAVARHGDGSEVLLVGFGETSFPEGPEAFSPFFPAISPPLGANEAEYEQLLLTLCHDAAPQESALAYLRCLSQDCGSTHRCLREALAKQHEVLSEIFADYSERFVGVDASFTLGILGADGCCWKLDETATMEDVSPKARAVNPDDWPHPPEEELVTET